MELKVKGKIISGDLKKILERLRIECHKPYLFKEMKESGDSLMVTCPYHSNGKESRPSCGFVNTRFGKSEFAKMHCFSCNKIVSLPQLVADLFESSLEFAEDWLCKNYGSDDGINIDDLPPINTSKKETFLDESILKNYDYYHPYMWQRKLTKEVVDKYRVGYDPLRKCITFPVWDIKGNLKMVTTRSVDTKKFYIQKSQDKLNNIGTLNGIKDVFGVTPYNNNMTYLQQAISLYPTLLNDEYLKATLREIKDSMVKRYKAGSLVVRGKYTFLLIYFISNKCFSYKTKIVLHINKGIVW